MSWRTSKSLINLADAHLAAIDWLAAFRAGLEQIGCFRKSRSLKILARNATSLFLEKKYPDKPVACAASISLGLSPIRNDAERSNGKILCRSKQHAGVRLSVGVVRMQIGLHRPSAVIWAIIPAVHSCSFLRVLTRHPMTGPI
jgi:hypothetical protein